MFHFPHGEQELWGIACRGDYDLKQHQKHSGKSMEVFDEAAKKKYVPHVIEPSLGVDRTSSQCYSGCEDEIPDDKGVSEKRTVLKFSPRIAPYKRSCYFPITEKQARTRQRADALSASLAPMRRFLRCLWSDWATLPPTG